MSINLEKLKKLNESISLSFKKKHIIILDPKEKNIPEENLEEDMQYDKIEWKIPKELEEFVKDLSDKDEVSNEDKILQTFKKICEEYEYDDNLISYIKKVDDDVYTVPDWYGRDVDVEWEDNRDPHKRRVCYELARYMAKSLKELLDKDSFDVSIYWNKDLTHYFVGLTCDDYSLVLDPDNFFNIKDLTR